MRDTLLIIFFTQKIFINASVINFFGHDSLKKLGRASSWSSNVCMRDRDSTGQFLNKQPTITFSPQCRNLIFRNNGFHFFFIHFKLIVFIGNCDKTVVILGEQLANLVLMWNSMWWNYLIESEGHTSDHFFRTKDIH